MKIDQIIKNYPFTDQREENFIILSAFVAISQRNRLQALEREVENEERQLLRDRYMEAVELLEDYRETLPSDWTEPQIDWAMGTDRPSMYINSAGESVELPGIARYEAMYAEFIADKEVEQEAENTAAAIKAVGDGVGYVCNALFIGFLALMGILLLLGLAMGG